MAAATLVRAATLGLTVTMGLATALGLAGCTGPAAPPSNRSITVIAGPDRQAAPAVEVELFDNAGTFRLADHAGEVVVLNFWGSWCAPCRAETDDLVRTYEETKADRVTFLGVNVRDQRDPAKQFIVAHKVTYPSVFDPAGRLVLGFNVPPSSIPSTVFIDRQGRVAAVVSRPLVREELTQVVRQLAAESPAPSPLATPHG